MLAQVKSCAIIGLEGAVVEVEVDISRGLPAFYIVGLPDTAVQESKERVRGAIRNSGCDFPMTRISVNLAPADLRKEGPAYDLPIAVSVLMASGQISADVSDTLLLGELSLDGSLRHTAGILPMVSIGLDHGFKRVVVPEPDSQEAALVEGIEVLGLRNLAQLVSHLRGEEIMEPVQRQPIPHGTEGIAGVIDLASLPGILPPLDSTEALEVTKIYSIAGMLPAGTPLITQRPFRAPHYTISTAGLVGGGRWPRPGEVTLSHRGVLFLDELPEFGQTTLEVLRQPLEDRIVTISRAQGTVTFPANYMFVAAMNPCPCGFNGDPYKQCSCHPAAVSRYQKRISGPLLDRIDLFVQVPRVDYQKLLDDSRAEPSSAVRLRVQEARQRQRRRFIGTPARCNADMSPVDTREHSKLDDGAMGLVQTAMRQFHLSARAFHRILKLSRTIADLAGSDAIATAHTAEALQYRARGLG
ncbi:MAG: ATP-binding protein [Chloroflexi bacterium]|nr:ATP-binding protein [Chloroflexota bacterium]